LAATEAIRGHLVRSDPWTECATFGAGVSSEIRQWLTVGSHTTRTFSATGGKLTNGGKYLMFRCPNASLGEGPLCSICPRPDLVFQLPQIFGNHLSVHHGPPVGPLGSARRVEKLRARLVGSEMERATKWQSIGVHGNMVLSQIGIHRTRSADPCRRARAVRITHRRSCRHRVDLAHAWVDDAGMRVRRMWPEIGIDLDLGEHCTVRMQGIVPLPAHTTFADVSLPAGALVMLEVVAAYPKS
jgi:hypothetical protein